MRSQLPRFRRYITERLLLNQSSRLQLAAESGQLLHRTWREQPVFGESARVIHFSARVCCPPLVSDLLLQKKKKHAVMTHV